MKSTYHCMGFPDDLCFICRTTQLKVRSLVVDTQPCSPACEVCVIAHAPVGVSGCPDDYVVRAARTCLQDDTCSSVWAKVLSSKWMNVLSLSWLCQAALPCLWAAFGWMESVPSRMDNTDDDIRGNGIVRERCWKVVVSFCRP